MACQLPEKRVRMPNFTEREIDELVDGYEANKIAIEAKGDGPHGARAKQRAWDRIAASLFAVSGIRREVAEIKKKWSDYKSAKKLRGKRRPIFCTALDSMQCVFIVMSRCAGAAVRRSQNKTGGGPGEPPLTGAEERVIGLLNNDVIVGIEGTYDIGVRQLGEC